MKKTVSILLCLLTVFCFAACGKQPEKTDTVKDLASDYKNYNYTKPDAKITASGKLLGNVTWEFYDDGSLFVEGNGSMPDWARIKDLAWRDKIQEIKSVHIGKGVTDIGDFAFAYCRNLTFVYIPDTVTSIGDSSFIRCENLKGIYIPESVTQIGASAFAFCLNLEEVNIPENVTYLAESTFSSCTAVKELNVHNNISYVGKGCFAGWTQEQKLNIDNFQSYIEEKWDEEWNLNCSATLHINRE